LGDETKSALREKLTAWNTYIRKEERLKNHLSFHFRKLEKKDNLNSKETEESK
jgi:hypothetical protein